jgi:Spy/CpxP family protein refolding chaperone
MNSALKWKLIAGFLLVFMAGGATGVFVTMAIGHHMFGPHASGFAAQAMKNRLQWHLKLTDEQMTKISPIIDKTGAQLEQIRENTGQRVRQTIAEAHREIMPLLTPEQQQRLRQMQERHRRWMQHRGGWRRNVSPVTEPSASATP